MDAIEQFTNMEKPREWWSKASVEQLKEMVSVGVRLDETVDDLGFTHLHHAACYSHNPDIIRFLVEQQGLDVNGASETGSVALDWALRSDKANLDVIEALVEAGANVNRPNSEGFFPLHTVLRTEDSSRALRYLLGKEDVDVNVCNANGETPLNYAMKIFASKVETELAGIGDTGLLADSRYYLAVCVAPLVQHRAIDAGRPELSEGKTPLHHLLDVRRPFPDEMLECLDWVVLEKLIDLTDLNQADASGRTVLEALVIPSPHPAYERLLPMFLKSGADIHFRGWGQQTILHKAIQNEVDSDVIRLLLELGADVNAEDEDGLTPLCLAAQFSKDSSVFHLLLDRGADVDTADRDGHLPLIILENRPDDIMNRLEREGVEKRLAVLSSDLRPCG